MINFHKINGKPSNQGAGTEHIWFSSPNGIYVAQNDGKPRLVSPGLQVGTTTPVGKPSEPGIFYYNSATRKHYISNDQSWTEIGVSGIPGSGSGNGNMAGDILINDNANYYTSIDVEGALSEIAEKFPWYFGSMQLADWTKDKTALRESAEKYITSTATGFPKTGWLINRKASNGNYYGLEVGENGELYTKKNDTFTQMANKGDVDTAVKNLTQAINNLNTTAGSWSLKAGEHIVISGNSVSGGQTIGVDPNFSKSIMDKVNGAINAMSGSYVRRSGDTMSGQLTMNNSYGNSVIQIGTYSRMQMLEQRGGSAPSSDANLGIVGDYQNPQFHIRDNKWGHDVMSYYPDKGVLAIRSNGGMHIANKTHGGKITFSNNATSGFPFEFRTTQSKSATFNHLETGQRLSIWGDTKGSWITADGGNRASNLYFSMNSGAWLREFGVRSNWSYTTRHLSAGAMMAVGMDPNSQWGTEGDYRKWIHLRIYPYSVTQAADSTNYFAIMRYNQKNNTLEFAQGVTSRVPGAGTINLGTQPNESITLRAAKFYTASAEKYKQNIRPLEDGALAGVMNTKPYTYNLKGQDTRSLGLVIERNAPKEIVSETRDSIDTYAMTAYLWKAVQELAEKVEKLSK